MDQPLPPESVLHSVVDTFFEPKDRNFCCVPETSFRQMFEDGTLPDYLLLAVLAAAVPFTTEAYYERTRKEAAISYAKQFWLSLSATDLKAEDPKIEVAETLSLLVVLDWSAGLVKAALQQAELLARLARAADLLTEPPSSLPLRSRKSGAGSPGTFSLSTSFMLTANHGQPLPFGMMNAPCRSPVMKRSFWLASCKICLRWTTF
ncbi:hypothetical protein BDV10DRAFT_160066 [Aspergillus recurvatus]